MESLNLFVPIYDQQLLARHLVLSGSIMFLGGLIIGLFVYGSKYPRLALYCHIEGVSYGGAMITTGLILTQKQFVGDLSKTELFGVWLGQVVGWPMWLSQILQAFFWGTNQMNRIAAEAAKAPGGKTWQENLVLTTHYAAALGIVGWGIVIKALLYPRLN